MTGRAGAHHAEHALLGAHLSGALAGRARLERRLALRAGAAAGIARLRARHHDLPVRSAERLLQRDLDVVTQVAAARGAVARAGAAAREHVLEAAAEDFVEQVGEVVEARGAWAERASARAAILERSLAVAVVS